MLEQEQMTDLVERIDNYLRTKARKIDAELEHFRIKRLCFAVDMAAKAIGPDGKMLSHQRRCGPEALAEAADRLSLCLPEIELCNSFDQLLKLVERETDDVERFGDLAQYDTTLRIGAKLTTSEVNVLPTVVYLHAGTREGARKLGFEVNQAFLTLQEIEKRHPELLRLKEPYHIENFLCCSIASGDGTGTG